MKKTVFTNILLLLLAAVMLLTMVGCGSKEEEKTLFEMENKVFDFHTAEQIKGYCQENELVTMEEEEFQVIYDVECFGQPSQVFYGFDEQNQVNSIISYVLMFGYKEGSETEIVSYTAAEMKQKCVQVLEELCKMHGTELQNNFFVLAHETYEHLDVTKEETYQKLMDGAAYLEFTMLDKTNSNWMVTSMCMPDGDCFLMVEKNYDSSDFADLVPNIKVQ